MSIPSVASLVQVSVIMPVYNEQDRIVQCIQSTRANLETLGMRYEIIVVDDGSTDGTRTEAMRVARNPYVKVLGYEGNRGKGFAVKLGTKHAAGDVVVLIDGDAEVRPGIIGQYVRVLEQNDVAIGSKWHPESRVSAPFLRKLLSHGFHCLVMLLTGVTVSDTQSGLKAFRREKLAKIMSLLSVKRYAFDVEMLAVARLLKMRIIELPIEIELRGAFSVRQVVRMFIDLLGIAYRLRIIRWYQRSLDNVYAAYRPIIRW